MPRVIVGYPLMRAELDRIRAGAPAGVEIGYGDLTSQAAADALDEPDLEAVFAPRLPADLSRTPKLRWQQATSAGIDLLAESKPWDRGVTLTNAAGVYAVPIAQYVLAAILRIAEKTGTRDAAQARRHWASEEEEPDYTGAQLREQTLLIVGYGGIGREVARLAKPFGLRILAVKARPEIRADRSWRLAGTGDPDGTLPDVLAGLDELDRLLRDADYVALTLPLTPQSRGIIGASRIAALEAAARVADQRRAGSPGRRDGTGRRAPRPTPRRCRPGRLRHGTAPARQPLLESAQHDRDAARLGSGPDGAAAAGGTVRREPAAVRRR